jgi:hypothetical protein
LLPITTDNQRKSSKQSDGNSRRPQLKDLVFFIERPLGKKVGVALRNAGLSVVFHLDHLPETADDEAYLALCVRKGWAVITSDSDIHDKPNQRRMVKNGRLRAFRLTGNHWPWAEKVRAFELALPAMGRLAQRLDPPFIARINKTGEIGKIDDFSDDR